jgi:ABC-type multidrug transport system permease subunit
MTALADGWVLAQRALMHWARQPSQVIVGLLFSVMVMLMFAYLFGGQVQVPGGGDYVDFLVPGMLAVTMLFGVESTVLAVVTDAARGVTERFRSMPIAPSAVVTGRAFADMLQSVLVLAGMIAAGLAIGWGWGNGAGDALAAVGLLLLLRFAFIWVGIFFGLMLETPEAAVAVQILVWPVGFLSSAFAAPETMPGWLGAIAAWNPVSATATAARELFGNPGWGGESWIAQHSVLMAVLWPLLLTAVFFPLAVARYRGLRK